METFQHALAAVNDFIWGWPMIIMLLGTHIFLTIRLKCPQRRIFQGIKLSVSKDKDSTGDVSQFEALATSLAATIGTGNIIGVATAISLGGPGAVLWCWLTGVFGIATKYSEGLLAIKYRTQNNKGKMLGGPMYALERGLHMKWLAVVFCVFTAIAAFGIGNTVQANAISENISLVCQDFCDPQLMKVIVGFVIATTIGFVIIGGIKSIAKWCTRLVPFMAVFYLLGCIYILCVNHAYLWDAVRLIVNEAFSFKAVGGGATGTVIMMAARYGIARGLFSNESGMGSAPIVAAAAQTKNPVRQALVSSTGTFWDTVVICAVTGLVVVTSILAYPHINRTDGGMLTKEAFGMIPYVGTPILTFGIITFAFSTILGWSYYAERAIEYLGGRRTIFCYRVLWILMLIVGSTMGLGLVWSIADLMNALMSIPNLISLLLLSGVCAKETQYYLWDNHINDIK